MARRTYVVIRAPQASQLRSGTNPYLIPMPTSLPPKPGPDKHWPGASPGSFRRLLGRDEAFTLIGMILVVFSVFRVWKSIPVPALPGSISGSTSIVKHGYGVLGSLFWVLLGCAIGAGTLLLWTPTQKSRQFLAATQGVLGLVCVAITLRYFAPQLGVVLALAGGGLLIYGAFERMSAR